MCASCSNTACARENAHVPGIAPQACLFCRSRDLRPQGLPSAGDSGTKRPHKRPGSPVLTNNNSSTFFQRIVGGKVNKKERNLVYAVLWNNTYLHRKQRQVRQRLYRASIRFSLYGSDEKVDAIGCQAVRSDRCQQADGASDRANKITVYFDVITSIGTIHAQDKNPSKIKSQFPWRNLSRSNPPDQAYYRRPRRPSARRCAREGASGARRSQLSAKSLHKKSNAFGRLKSTSDRYWTIDKT